MEAFVYVWTDKITNKLYVGVHKGTLDDGYICSSKHMLKEYTQRPETFSRQIIAHGTWDDMRAFETKILTSVDARKDVGFYNRTNGHKYYYNKGHLPETVAKIAAANKGQKRTEEQRNKMSVCKIGNNFAAGTRTEESKERMSKSSARKGNIGTFTGRTHTDDSKQKMSNAAKADPNRRVNSSKAGKQAAASRRADPIEFEAYKKRQSEYMKQVWATRKQKRESNGE